MTKKEVLLVWFKKKKGRSLVYRVSSRTARRYRETVLKKKTKKTITTTTRLFFL